VRRAIVAESGSGISIKNMLSLSQSQYHLSK
jgi:hypothetical protein